MAAGSYRIPAATLFTSIPDLFKSLKIDFQINTEYSPIDTKYFICYNLLTNQNMKIRINPTKCSDSDTPEDVSDSTVAVIHKPTPDTVIVNATRTNAGNTMTMRSAAPVTLLAAGGLTPAEFWENMKQTIDLAHIDPWEGMLFGVTMACSYLIWHKFDAEFPEEGKLGLSGLIAATVLAIANGTNPNPEGISFWDIVIAICVLYIAITKRKDLWQKLKGKTDEEMEQEELAKLQAEEAKKKPAGHKGLKKKEPASHDNETTQPTEDKSGPVAELYPCSNCKTEAGEPKPTKGKNFCADCLTPRTSSTNNSSTPSSATDSGDLW